MYHSRTLVSAALALAISQTVSAQQSEEIVVTATRTATPIAQTLAPVTVLDHVQIAKLQVADVPELISRFTGVDMVQRGGAGANSSAFVRGTNSGHLLVLIDGVRVGSATLGASALELLDPAAIERIELVRGPLSSLYGSDAIGGTLQIFTRKAETTNLALKVGLGKHNERHYRAAAGWANGDSHVNLIVSRVETDGFDRTLNAAAGNDDKDGYRADRVALSAGHNLSENWQLDAALQHQQGESDTDNGFCFIDCEPYTQFSNGSVDVGLKGQLTQIWASQWRLGFAQDESEQADHIPGVAALNWGGNNSFTTRRDSASWQNDIALAPSQLLSVGVDYYRDEVDANNVSYIVDSRINTGLFAQYQLSVNAHSVVLAARNDDNEQFGSETTGNLAYGFSVSDDWSLSAAIGSGFKAPSFNDLYWPFAGNAELAPETSRNIEAGIKFQQEDVRAAVNVFRNDIDNLIAWAPDLSGTWLPANVGEAEIVGIEADLVQQLGDWQVSANYTWLDAKDSQTDKRLINRAQQLFNADLSREFGAVSLAVGVEARSSRYADAANSQRLAGYGLVNLRAAWAITSQAKVEAKINNLLGHNYTVVSGYREDGVNALVSASYQF